MNPNQSKAPLALTAAVAVCLAALLLLNSGGCKAPPAAAPSQEWTPDGKPVKQRMYNDTEIDHLNRLYYLEKKQQQPK